MAARQLIACPDKYRGTASADEIATAMVAGATQAGWCGVAAPLADGGEGLLETVGGDPHHALVTGPLGKRVRAEWRMLATTPVGPAPVAVIEMARASGLQLAGGPEKNDAFVATTFGTGELIAAAVAAGAKRVVVGCGGSATSDGGKGALDALSDVELSGVELVVACDVRTRFLEAADVFGPQKGADAATVERLNARLTALAGEYARMSGIDVASIPGTGAAGGLAGGLVALGGRIVTGFDLVADLVGLERLLGNKPSLVVTGEGRLDATSFAGKVVGGVIQAVDGRAPVLIVVGAASADLALPDGVHLVVLADRYGLQRALSEPLSLVAEVIESFLTTPSIEP